MVKRERPTSVYVLIIFNLALALGAAFVAMLAAGSFPDITKEFDPTNGYAQFFLNYADADGRETKLMYFFGALAAIKLLLAGIQFRGLGIGWTFEALLSILGILASIGYILLAVPVYIEAATSPTPVIYTSPATFLTFIGIFIATLIILAIPSVQQFFGRFDLHE